MQDVRLFTAIGACVLISVSVCGRSGAWVLCGCGHAGTAGGGHAGTAGGGGGGGGTILHCLKAHMRF